MRLDVAQLVPLSDELIEFIRPWASNGICEIGSSHGFWAEKLNASGIPTIGYDINPAMASDIVRTGDHVEASQHSDMTLLIVWPPDGGKQLQEWIRAWRGDTIILCAHKTRVKVGDVLDGFKKKAAIEDIPGIKGLSTITVYQK